MSSIVLDYQRQAKRFLDRYPAAELEHRASRPPARGVQMSPAVFHSRMRAVNDATQRQPRISRSIQLRVLSALGIVAAGLTTLVAAMAEGRIPGDACTAGWLAAVLAVVAAMVVCGAFFSVQNQQHRRRVVAGVRSLLETFNLTDRAVGMEWRLKRPPESRGAGWLSPVLQCQIVIATSNDAAAQFSETTRYSGEVDVNDLPPPSYAGPLDEPRVPCPLDAGPVPPSCAHLPRAPCAGLPGEPLPRTPCAVLPGKPRPGALPSHAGTPPNEPPVPLPSPPELFHARRRRELFPCD